MAVNSILPPYPIFTGADGKPLEGGYIFIGQPGLEARSAPKASFFDVAQTIPTGTASGAAVRTVAGYPVFNGSAAMIYVDQDCSITVTDKNGVVVFATLNRTLTLGSTLVVAPLLAPDGNLPAPGFAYISEPNTGRMRAADGVEQDVVLGQVISQRGVLGTTFPMPVTISALETVTDINVLKTGQGAVIFSNTATGAEGGLGTYTTTLLYRGDGTTAVQQVFIRGTGFRYRSYAAGAWSAWASLSPDGLAANTLLGNPTGSAGGAQSVSMANLMTMLGFAQVISANGYIQVPGNTRPTIIQWFSIGPIVTGANGAVSFPIAFPNACRAVIPAYVSLSGDATVGENAIGQVRSLSASSVTIRNLASIAAQFHVLAIGD